MQDSNHSIPPDGSRKRRRLFAGVLTGGLLGGLLAGSVSAWSGAHDGARGPHCVGRHAMSPEARAERIEFATDRMLTKIDATEEQRQRVKAIVNATLTDLMGLREQHTKNKAAFVEQLKQEAIDRAALEDIRRNELQLADTASSRIVTALADVADVLKPEQRARLARMLEEWRR